MIFKQPIKFCILFMIGMWLGACGRSFRAPVVDQTRLGQIKFYAKKFDALFQGSQKKDDHLVLKQQISGFTAERQRSEAADGQFAMAVLENNCTDKASATLAYSNEQLAQTARVGQSAIFGEDSQSGYGFNIICVPQKIDGEHVCNQYIVAVSKFYDSNRVGSVLILLEEVLDPDNVGQKKLLVKDLAGLPKEFVRPMSVGQMTTQRCSINTIPNFSNNPGQQPNGGSGSTTEQDDEADFGWIEDLFEGESDEFDEPIGPFVVPEDENLVPVGEDDPWWYN